VEKAKVMEQAMQGCQRRKPTRSFTRTLPTSYRKQGCNTSTTSWPKDFRKNHRNPSGETSRPNVPKLLELLIIKEKGQVHSEPMKKASIIAHQFRSVFTVDNATVADIYLHGPSIPPLPDLDISEMGIKKLLKGVDPGKVSGPDQIPCRLLHELHAELAPVFTVAP
jgi:hypothetical protein